MQTQGERLRELRESRGWKLEPTAAMVSRLYGKKVSYQSIQNLELGNTQSSAFFPELCDIYGVSVKYARTGIPQSENDASHNARLDKNLRPGPELVEKVPLISWTQAGEMGIEIALMDESDAESWEPCPMEHSSNTYALRVEDDSMVSSHGDSFPKGIIIIVDPGPINDIVPGDFVVAKIKSNSVVTFKQLIEEDGNQFLRPLNRQSQSIREPFDLLGKIIWYGKEPGNY